MAAGVEIPNPTQVTVWRFPVQLSDRVDIPKPELSVRICSWFGNLHRAEPKAFGQGLAVQGPLLDLGSDASGKPLA